MKTVSFLFQKMRNVELAFAKKQGAMYLRLLFSFLVEVRLFRSKKMKETVFGYTVSFFDYAAFLSMFEEVFIHEAYRFTSKKTNPLIMDCGTNIGLELIYYKRLYPKSTVLCFEPDKKTFRLLQKNIRTNDLENIHPYNFAIGNKKGKTFLYINPKDPGSLIMSTHKKRGLSKKTVIQMDRLSSFMKMPVDFLKLDIEGSEGVAIEDLHKRKKLRQVKQMVIEYHHHIESRKDNLSKLLRILEANQFGYQIITPLRTPFEKEKYQDILIFAYKKGRS